MAIWKLILHHEEDNRQDMLKWSRSNGCIALGWGKIEVIPHCDSPECIEVKIRMSGEYDDPPRFDGGPSLWSFYNEIEKGDLVILVGKGSRRVAVMEITGDAKRKLDECPILSGQLSDYAHQRDVRERPDTLRDELWKNVSRAIRTSHKPLLNLNLEHYRDASGSG